MKLIIVDDVINFQNFIKLENHCRFDVYSHFQDHQNFFFRNYPILLLLVKKSINIFLLKTQTTKMYPKICFFFQKNNNNKL